MEINLNDIAKMLKGIKMQTKVIENAFKAEADKNKAEPKGVFVQHIEEDYHAEKLAEQNSEEIRKQIEEEVHNKINTNIAEENATLEGEPDLDLIKEQQDASGLN